MSSLASGIGVTKQPEESKSCSNKFTNRFHWIAASRPGFSLRSLGATTCLRSGLRRARVSTA
jgi:hypothetical protein